MLSWLPWKPPGSQISTLAKKINFRHPPTQSNPETLCTNNAHTYNPETRLICDVWVADRRLVFQIRRRNGGYRGHVEKLSDNEINVYIAKLLWFLKVYATISSNSSEQLRSNEQERASIYINSIPTRVII